MTTLRSKDYEVAVATLELDTTVIAMAKEAVQMYYPQDCWNYSFVSSALREYTKRQGKNQDAAHHHIGAVAEAIRKINGWA